MAEYEKVLTRNVGVPRAYDIDVYESRGGYAGLKKALTEFQPDQVTDLVKNTGLRGRGGAGFATGLKWSFVPKGPMQKYLVVNGDESEPGTFHDRELLENDPHQLVEGAIITCYAVGITKAFFYIRGEFALGYHRLQNAVKQAYEKGYLGKNILGGGFSCDAYTIQGAGAYICGEESALLESLEGNRPMPRSRPPFPAVVGLYAGPTVVNSVETISNIPHILVRGLEWYTSLGTAPRNTGPFIYSLSGHVNNPGNHEGPLGLTIGELVNDIGGGVLGGRTMKAFIPGGASSAWLKGDCWDVKLDFDTLGGMKTMLGSGAQIVLDDQCCVPHAAVRLAEFYNHESCGKCTPCREGTRWMVKLGRRIIEGSADSKDIDTLFRIADRIGFGPPNKMTLCALGDASTSCITSTVRQWRDEWEYHAKHGRCPTPTGKPVNLAV
ncbi:MAG: NADH-quinone oxidoreductase subunit NuoF [Chloroflexota bacterium]|nr:MAG: NADH-quinone oxidoreductase subunit NuoF [Chloroflexota bacterium]